MSITLAKPRGRGAAEEKLGRQPQELASLEDFGLICSFICSLINSSSSTCLSWVLDQRNEQGKAPIVQAVRHGDYGFLWNRERISGEGGF